MKVFKAKLNGKEFKLAVAVKDEDKTKGLSDTKKLKKDAGMLFVFDKEQKVVFNTMKMNYPIDMLFLDADWNVVDYVIGYPKRNMFSSGVKYVIEVNAGEMPAQIGTNLAPGEDIEDYVSKLDVENRMESKEISDTDKDKKKEEKSEEKEKPKNIIVAVLDTPEMELFRNGGKVIRPKEDKIKAKPGHMQVLDDEGTILMNITGGERIFSRIHTKKIVSSAKKVKNGEMTPEEFGEILAEIIHIQDNQKPEYVYE